MNVIKMMSDSVGYDPEVEKDAHKSLNDWLAGDFAKMNFETKEMNEDDDKDSINSQGESLAKKALKEKENNKEPHENVTDWLRESSAKKAPNTKKKDEAFKKVKELFPEVKKKKEKNMSEEFKNSTTRDWTRTKNFEETCEKEKKLFNKAIKYMGRHFDSLDDVNSDFEDGDFDEEKKNKGKELEEKLRKLAAAEFGVSDDDELFRFEDESLSEEEEKPCKLSKDGYKKSNLSESKECSPEEEKRYKLPKDRYKKSNVTDSDESESEEKEKLFNFRKHLRK